MGAQCSEPKLRASQLRRQGGRERRGCSGEQSCAEDLSAALSRNVAVTHCISITCCAPLFCPLIAVPGLLRRDRLLAQLGRCECTQSLLPLCLAPRSVAPQAPTHTRKDAAVLSTHTLRRPSTLVPSHCLLLRLLPYRARPTLPGVLLQRASSASTTGSRSTSPPSGPTCRRGGRDLTARARRWTVRLLKRISGACLH